jgi:hypothetical protein
MPFGGQSQEPAVLAAFRGCGARVRPEARARRLFFGLAAQSMAAVYAPDHRAVALAHHAPHVSRWVTDGG